MEPLFKIWNDAFKLVHVSKDTNKYSTGSHIAFRLYIYIHFLFDIIEFFKDMISFE